MEHGERHASHAGRLRGRALGVAVVTLVALLVLAATSAARGVPDRGATSATIVNFDPGAPDVPGQPHGAQVAKLDVNGNQIDTGSDYIAHFGDYYYMYGESAGCGFRWNVGGFCGFNVYRSRDLVHWRLKGKILDPATSTFAQQSCRTVAVVSCWGPMVIYNRRTRKYVLWFYISQALVDGHNDFVAESDSPVGPFSEPREPSNIPLGAGFAPDLFVDKDGSAYISSSTQFAPGEPGGFNLVVQRLNDSYTDATGPMVQITQALGTFRDPRCRPPLGAATNCGLVESPSMLRHGNAYYLTFSDPICGYCAGGTSYFVARSPLGPWYGQGGSPSLDPVNRFRAFVLSTDSCGGQPFHVAHLPTMNGEDVNLYISLQWYNSRNEAVAGHYWSPLRYRDGLLEPLDCAATERVPLAQPVPSNPPVEQHARNLCVAGSGNSATQTLTAPAEGEIRSLDMSLYQMARPVSVFVPEGLVSAPVVVDLLDTRTNQHATATLTPDQVPWAATRTQLTLPLDVRKGDQLTLSTSSTTPQGCYGTLYSVHDPYSGGRLSATGDAQALATASSDLLFSVKEVVKHRVVEFGDSMPELG